MPDLRDDIAACRLCTERFAATATGHAPNPVVWFRPGARILVASQAPGLRVHHANTPFWDRSGQRLRDWMGVDEATFYDRACIAILPMAFCFPGYDTKGGDLPPPRICAETWRARAMEMLEEVELTLLIGAHAQTWHLGGRMGVTERVAGWRDHAPKVFPLPHPSWRNTAWLRKNPWFEAELLPVLRTRIREVLDR
jgi:uracil-DNA glycosylase